MGMFDNVDDKDALTRALIMAGLGMAAGRGNAVQNIAQGGMFGMQQYDQALTQRDKRAEEAQQRAMRQMQIDQAQRAMSDQEAQRSLAARAFAPGAAPLVPNDDSGNPMPMAGAGGGIPEYIKGLMPINPDKGIALQQSFAKETPWAKLNPKDFTPASIQRFSQTNNMHDLVPLEKAHFADTGAGVVPLDPYSGKPLGEGVSKTLSPAEKDAAARGWATFNRGELREFPTAEGGTGMGFITPSGVTQVPGTGTKPEKEAATIRQSLAQNAVTLNKIDRAIDMVDQQPGAFGLKNMLGDSVRQRTNPEGVDARALVADIGSQKLHDRSGAAVTVSEAPRLTPFVPNVNDNAETIKKKLGLFRTEYAQMHDELASGKTLNEVAMPPNRAIGKVSGAEAEAELMRRGKRP